MIYVQHLLGIGHLNRSIHLATALVQHGFEVELVSGGIPQAGELAEGIQLTQLPPLRSIDGTFSRLVDIDGNEINQRWKTNRKNQLLELFSRFSPDVFITESFPFAKRMMRFELLPLLDAAKAGSNKILVVSSIRDILQPKLKPGRNQETCDIINRLYDRVLIHGDPDIARLEDSFTLADRIASKVFYSGYIGKPCRDFSAGDEGENEVLVSAGGSATGLQLLKTAIAAKPLSILDDLRWRVLVSPSVGENDFQELQSQASAGIVVERNRQDFTELLQRARLSISQAGYNTITDILQSDAAAIVIPFAEAEEEEQTIRANLLQQKDRLIALTESCLSARSLVDAIQQTLKLKSGISVAKLDGARQSAIYIDQWLDELRSSP